MKSRKKSDAWFYAIRGSYLPKQGIGLAVYLVYVLYLIALLGAWLASGHTVWRLLTAVIPLMVAAAVLLQYIASRHSR